MSEIITCPLPEGMARRGSPLVTVDNLTRGCFYRARVRCTALDIMFGCGEIHVFAWDRLNGAVGEETQLPICNVEMDLTDATGRAHAAWWIAQTLGFPRHLTASFGFYCMGGNKKSAGWILSTLGKIGSWVDHQRVFVQSSDGWQYTTRVVPALADLDPTDDTRLPDGSRVVDALALKAVVEHLISQMEKTS